MEKKPDQKRKMQLTVRGIQKGFGQEEVSELTTCADYYTKDGRHYLFYSEITEEGRTIKNRLTIDSDVVELKKSGGGDSLLRFRKGHSEDCLYQSPAGLLRMVSDTKAICLHTEEDGLSLQLEYAFYTSGMLVSDYCLTVEAKGIAKIEE